MKMSVESYGDVSRVFFLQSVNRLLWSSTDCSKYCFWSTSLVIMSEWFAMNWTPRSARSLTTLRWVAKWSISLKLASVFQHLTGSFNQLASSKKLNMSQDFGPMRSFSWVVSRTVGKIGCPKHWSAQYFALYLTICLAIWAFSWSHTLLEKRQIGANSSWFCSWV